MQIHNCWAPTRNGVRTQKVEHVSKADYDALAADILCKCCERNKPLYDAALNRILALEAALREAKPQLYSPNSQTHALIEKLLGSELETSAQRG